MTTVPAAGTMLGRYQVLRPLAKGGMAEVLLARTIGLGGFARYVVIKRVRVENNDQHAMDMFLDEARLVASLHHRNIVQVHDVGEEDNKYFFVMEYVHGRDTRELLRQVKDLRQNVPLEHVVTIVSAAAAGLHYAHEQRGADRQPLGIVHRDISPGNILLAFDGAVKVVDFGIAKAAARSRDTEAGATKGKLGYMSPEQCRAQPIDRRTDIFQLGIVLWELCTVKRLFKGENRYDTMGQIVDGSIPPPSKSRFDFPPELEHIILKALAKAPDDRFQTADELRLALEAFAAKSGLPISQSRLADYLKGVFGDVPEPWLEGEQVPPPPADVIERIRSSSQLIAVGSLRPSQPMPIVETSKPEPLAPPAPPVLPDRLSIHRAPTVDATKSTQPELEALKAAKPVVAGAPAGPDEDEHDNEDDNEDDNEPDDEDDDEAATAAPAPASSSPARLVSPAPIASPAATEPPARAPAPVARARPAYPVYPTAPRSRAPVLFIALFVIVAAGIGGAFVFLRSDLEQTRAATPASPADAPTRVEPQPQLQPDAATVLETVPHDAAASPLPATATIDGGATAGPSAGDASVETPRPRPKLAPPKPAAKPTSKPRPTPKQKPTPKPTPTSEPPSVPPEDLAPPAPSSEQGSAQ